MIEFVPDGRFRTINLFRGEPYERGDINLVLTVIHRFAQEKDEIYFLPPTPEDGILSRVEFHFYDEQMPNPVVYGGEGYAFGKYDIERIRANILNLPRLMTKGLKEVHVVYANFRGVPVSIVLKDEGINVFASLLKEEIDRVVGELEIDF